ncbi:TPA: putative toxin-antitoxin system toxin component, PIN family, partial [bacterium]|nr:putative toxin-antitoxin system toxin component, PIN family [bacterium]
VLDTNALISGILLDGNEARIIEEAENNKFKLFISHKILRELEGVLKRNKFTRRLKDKETTVNQAIAKISLIATLIKSSNKINIIKEDPDDNRVLECAVAAGADIIISGDKHLLSLGTFLGIDIMSAGDYFKRKESFNKHPDKSGQ